MGCYLDYLSEAVPLTSFLENSLIVTVGPRLCKVMVQAGFSKLAQRTSWKELLKKKGGGLKQYKTKHHLRFSCI